MKAFISAVLGYDPKQEDTEGGVLGVVKAYYGCVEAQGRGTLHCHMMVWLEGGLDPNEIKERVVNKGDVEFRDRLLAFLDDSITNSVIADPDPDLTVPASSHHPCSVRGVHNSVSEHGIEKERQKDMHHLSRCCQYHSHSATCYKYWKGPPARRECRFDLDEANFCANSHFDYDTDEICLRCLDGMVNNFNETILEAVRCNMDIKFIGSGASAKAIMYYITDYITKSQLKAHVAYAALELSVKKLGEYDASEDNLTVRAKQLLRKCAYAMISHQELSAQQVCSYLMDFEDHFTSHNYRNIYWTSFERYIDGVDPSPECYRRSATGDRPHDFPATSEQNLCENEDDDQTNDDEYLCDTNAAAGETDNVIEEMADNGLSSEEVGVATDDSGHLVAKGNQVVDYQLRGDAFNDLTCSWTVATKVPLMRLLWLTQNIDSVVSVRR
ncbi:hypothetical protein BV22DRAFT_1101407 [Leucogyrophana mollusca]|uniref:Uncharacterized protein n=1 Tax=Leucogyrophana mollusca TaxID=85980 RepID=A0ACB8BYK4_9AGAM|nr:hypothetical protein BV22DRAFT_1101407 [Leucogyrophana mollusca]